jgi:3-O-methylgallate 3,4-dioxygenase
MSHSSLVVTPESELWLAHDAIDRANPHLRDKAGRPVTYAELEEIQGSDYAEQATPEHLGRQIEQVVSAVARLRADLAALEPDVLITFGDDQEELLSHTNVPALAIYHGATLTMGTSMRFASYEQVLGDVSPMMAGYAMDARHTFPGHAGLGTHLVGDLVRQGFDITAVSDVPDDGVTGLGHSFGIMETQLMDRPGAIPQIPVLVNTYWPPNQPTVPRSYDLGLAIRRAVESYPEDLRVAVVASGGLSHFTTDEALDRRVLEACRSSDAESLRRIDPALLNGGSSEIRNWIATAGACVDLPVRWDEYVPVYRTPAGTGIGLAFALWAGEPA